MSIKFNFDSLVKRKLVSKKTYANGLSIFKYTKRVFFDNLWAEDSRLMEARGIVLDADGVAVLYPFTKVFNYRENGTSCPEDATVVAVRKLNGFMASARYYQGEVLVASSGTMDSEFVELARKVLKKQCSFEDPFWQATMRYTLIFEICDESDPHIVQERSGAYLIGARNMYTGRLESEDFLDFLASRAGFLRPSAQKCKFDEAVALSKVVEHEGFMIRDLSGNTLMKIKSPHYLTKKALMRVGSRQIDVMFSDPETFRQRLDEEFYEVFEDILALGKDHWAGLTEVSRRKFLENYFEENC